MIKLSFEQIKSFNKGYCPKCQNRKFLHGPRGGMSENIRCTHCGAEYAFMYPFDVEQLDRNAPNLYRGEFFLKDLINQTDQILYNQGLAPRKPWWKRIIATLQQ